MTWPAGTGNTGQWCATHKARHPDSWDPPVHVYGRYWPGDEFIDAT
jgi:hypothetical protein